MHKGVVDLTDMTFGRLTAKEKVPAPRGLSEKRRGAWWRCECRCGGQKIASANNLKAGNTSSCGCLARERAEKARAEKIREAQRKEEEKPQDGAKLPNGLQLLAATCVCYSCRKKFDRLSAEWRYKAVIRGKMRWFCSWRCYREATNKPKKPHGNSSTARVLASE